MPGREDVRLLLEEAMREEGWTGGRMEERRRAEERRAQRFSKRKALQESVGKILDIGSTWWGDLDADAFSDASDNEDDSMSDDDKVFVSNVLFHVCLECIISRVLTPRPLPRTTLQCWCSRLTHYPIYFKPSLSTSSQG